MTQEEKQLLIKDLCARLPYQPMFHWESPFADGEEEPFDDALCIVNTCDDLVYGADHDELNIEDIRLYLRQISSITDEELDTLIKRLNNLGLGRVISKDNFTIEPFGVIWFYNMRFSDCVSNIMMSTVIDFLNSIHIDHRELIKKGLALKAPEGMYNS